MNLLVPVSPGEMIDKITILEIKLEKLGDPAKLANVRIEHSLLSGVLADKIKPNDKVLDYKGQLKEVNLSLWEIEDSIRICERNRSFGEEFIALARAVYRTNDRRAEIKRDINVLLNSGIMEEKSYAAY